MNTTLARIAMAAPIAAALLALTAGWASAQPGPNFPVDVATAGPIVDPQPPKPPKWQHLPVVDVNDIAVDPDPAPPADDPTPPADNSDDSDHHDSDHDGGKSHGSSSAGGTTVRPAGSTSPVVAETDTAFQASDARNASDTISPKFIPSANVQQMPLGVVFGVGALLVAVIGWAAFRHHRLSN